VKRSLVVLVAFLIAGCATHSPEADAQAQAQAQAPPIRFDSKYPNGDNVALFEALDDLDSVGADDPDLDILAALAIAIFDHHEATTFKRANCLGRQPERIVFA